jgi:hypothetical protein
LHEHHAASPHGEEPFTITGRFVNAAAPARHAGIDRSEQMHGLIYLIGLIVVILAILSFFGLR